MWDELYFICYDLILIVKRCQVSTHDCVVGFFFQNYHLTCDHTVKYIVIISYKHIRIIFFLKGFMSMSSKLRKRTLLKNCDGIPLREDVGSKDRHYTQIYRIWMPIVASCQSICQQLCAEPYWFNVYTDPNRSLYIDSRVLIATIVSYVMSIFLSIMLKKHEWSKAFFAQSLTTLSPRLYQCIITSLFSARTLTICKYFFTVKKIIIFNKINFHC